MLQWKSSVDARMDVGGRAGAGRRIGDALIGADGRRIDCREVRSTDLGTCSVLSSWLVFNFYTK